MVRQSSPCPKLFFSFYEKQVYFKVVFHVIALNQTGLLLTFRGLGLLYLKLRLSNWLESVNKWGLIMKRLFLGLMLLINITILADSLAMEVNKLYLENYGICDDCYLRGINFNKLKMLPGVKITSMQRSDLTGADLRGLSLMNVDLTGANLTDTNLTGVDLNSAKLTGAILDHTNVTDANLRNIWVR